MKIASLTAGLNSGSKMTKAGDWLLLTLHLPGRPPAAIGVLLLDTDHDRLHIKLRDEPMAENNELAQILANLESDLQARAHEIGSGQLVDWLESTPSHTIRFGRRTRIEITDAEKQVNALYREHVANQES